MVTVRDRVIQEIRSSIAAKHQALASADVICGFERAVERIVACFQDGGRLYIAGNGGSSSDAQHLAAEFVCKLTTPRAPLPAEALTSDTATLTAISNDFSFDELFARQLECKATHCDVFLALTTSGRSRNIVRALQQCRSMGTTSVLFTGRGGGDAARFADICLIAPGENSCRVQEVHIVLYHTLVACVENALFFDQAAQPSLVV